MNVTTKKFLKYTLLPGIAPRMRELVGGGFAHIAFYLAQVYAAVRLLPRGHAYLNPANIGRFGIRHVVAAAAGHLQFKKENSDQIIIFFLMLIGLAILSMQFILLGFAIFVQTTHAASLPTNFAGFFLTPLPPVPAGGGTTDDIAFVLLDRVFGVPGMFLYADGVTPTCVEAGTPCFNAQEMNPTALPEGAYPWPFHKALRMMMQYYSIGLLVVGMFIFFYFLVAVVLETAQDGTPFGRRFNHVWAPIRMVVALGLLIPVANGLNAAQYITLYAAWWGSGFATNGWNLFVANAIPAPPPGGTDTPAGDTTTLVATPTVPEMTNLLEFYTVALTCWAAYQGMINPPVDGIDIEAWLVIPGGGPANRLSVTTATTFNQALQFTNYHDIDIRYGECTMTGNTDKKIYPCDNGVNGGCGDGSGCSYNFQDQQGYVKPTCGEVVIPVESDVKDTAIGTNPDPGAYYMSQQWWELTSDLWWGSTAVGVAGCPVPGNLAGRGCWGGGGPPTNWQCPVGTALTGGDPFSLIEQWGFCIVARYGLDDMFNYTPPVPTNNDVKFMLNPDPTSLGWFNIEAALIIQDAVTLDQKSVQWSFTQAQKGLGWAGAGLWYHEIAKINGALINAVNDIPVVKSYPMLMEQTRKSRLKCDRSVGGREVFRPVCANDVGLADETKNESFDQGDKITKVLWQAYDLWRDAAAVKVSGNWVVDLIKGVTGTAGLFAITDASNINVHPLALLVGIGKSMLDAALTNMAYASGGAVLARVLGNQASMQLVDPIAKFLWSLGVTCGGIGVMLYYVLPFMPFLYYFFAVATWVKGLFEAMVGVPLWALAHIRIDGDGLAGTPASSGYFMIMEIFLRPILIVFGLLSSIVIFAAQVRVLHDIWPLVTSNLTGFNTDPAVVQPAGDTGSLTYYRGEVDQFFFTVIYAIVVYMMGMASFKLITTIPSKVIRWIGANVDAFNDQEDIAQGLMSNMQTGSSLLQRNLTGAFDQTLDISRSQSNSTGAVTPGNLASDLGGLASGGPKKS